MVSKQNSYHRGGEQPPDEGWWAALLSEEGRYNEHITSRQVSDAPQNDTKPTAAPDKQPKMDWLHIQELHGRDETVYLQVSGANRGGLLVEGDGIHGFVPVSHLVDIDLEPLEDERELQLETYVGQTLCLKVIECNPERGRVVLSQRAALAGSGRRNRLFETLKVGETVRGTVTNVTDFGAFVDLGGVEGLLHVSELSWGRVHHPSDVVTVGTEIETMIINVNKERLRVALSLKRIRPNPWETAEERYSVGQIVDATISGVVEFGAFARLEEGLDGLIHVSAMELEDSVDSHRDMIQEGQPVRVRVLHVDASRQRLGLSLVQGDE